MVALIEDREEDAELISEVFREYNSSKEEMVWFQNAESFLMFLKNEGSDNLKLIISDLKMDVIDGIELLKRLEKEKKYKQIPFVVLSTSVMESDVTESYKYGANGYVTKPIELDSLRSKIASISNFWLKVNTTFGAQ